MATVSIRYIVDDVNAAIAFYCSRLGFSEQMHPGPSFAMLTRGDLRLVLSSPGGGPGGGPSGGPFAPGAALGKSCPELVAFGLVSEASRRWTSLVS